VLDGTYTVGLPLHWSRLPQSVRDAYKAIARECKLPSVTDKRVKFAIVSNQKSENRYMMVSLDTVPVVMLVKHDCVWIAVPVPSVIHA
jgi:hypothetical protein